jgi:hypothetical protein
MEGTSEEREVSAPEFHTNFHKAMPGGKQGACHSARQQLAVLRAESRIEEGPDGRRPSPFAQAFDQSPARRQPPLESELLDRALQLLRVLLGKAPQIFDLSSRRAASP